MTGANRPTGRSAPNGVTSSYAYDGLDRLTRLMHTAGGNTLNGNLYTYNNANNISSWTTATAQKAYTYDAVDRLTSVTNYEMPAENYSYDGVGNRTSSHLSATCGYQPFNKLTSTASATYSYDDNGNLVSKTDASGTTMLNDCLVCICQIFSFRQLCPRVQQKLTTRRLYCGRCRPSMRYCALKSASR